MTVRAGDHVDGGTYLDIGGRPVWHLQIGDPAGPATVLVHGAFASAATWAAQIADFAAAGREVYVPERSGHGHSPDVDEPFTFDAMTDQLIGYLEAALDRPADLVGWSDGATIALLAAARRPDLVNRLVIACNYLNPEGEEAGWFFRALAQNRSETIDYLRNGYVDFTPDGPEHFDVVFAKSAEMLREGPRYSIEDFADLQIPTLVVAADKGVVRLEHSLALARALPHGRLAVLPGTHILPAEAPELFDPLVLSFLAADPPSTWLPA